MTLGSKDVEDLLGWYEECMSHELGKQCRQEVQGYY